MSLLLKKMMSYSGTSAEVITLSGTAGAPNTTIDNAGSAPASAEAGFLFLTTGGVTAHRFITGDAAFQAGTEWCNQAPVGSYWIRFTSNTGTDPSIAMNTWLALTTQRDCVWQAGTAAETVTGSVKVEIASDSGGATIVATGYYGGTAIVEA